MAATSVEAAGDSSLKPPDDDCYSALGGATVKTEVGVFINPRWTQAKRGAESMEDERATPAEFGLGPEPDVCPVEAQGIRR